MKHLPTVDDVMTHAVVSVKLDAPCGRSSASWTAR